MVAVMIANIFFVIYGPPKARWDMRNLTGCVDQNEGWSVFGGAELLEAGLEIVEQLSSFLLHICCTAPIRSIQDLGKPQKTAPDLQL